MADDLFANLEPIEPRREKMADGAILLRGKALPLEHDLLLALQSITGRAPFRHMVTPGGFVMSVAMTNCGRAGWVTDLTGYRYDNNDPESGKPWPAMPDPFLRLATEAAAEAGYPGFIPDACLINRYEPARVCRCTRTKTSATLRTPLCPCRLDCRRSSNSED